MSTHTLLLFSATVVPLVCTPGPDMLLVSSQAISAGRWAGLRATTGVLLGYLAHSLMVSLGLAALIAASPFLFATIRWAGIGYLLFLAGKLLGSALKPGAIELSGGRAGSQLRKGFLTSLLNPKGILVYVAIFPQFMDRQRSAPLQVALLSTTFIFWCAVVYSSLAIVLSATRSKTVMSERRRSLVDGAAGGLILVAAGFMAAT